jgi:hypothetical protein
MSQVPRPRPQLMVIGDSLSQGCRSLTVNAAFCAQSWPARIAQEQTWEFVTPDFPRPVLLDLEEEVRRLPLLTLSIANLRLEGIVDRIRANVSAWLKDDVDSAVRCFDNLGLTGALVGDLYTRSAASSAAEISQLVPDGPGSVGAMSDPELLAKLPDLHLPINARFTLNPSQDPAFSTFTPLDWVRERKPRVLAVHVGHNHGIYRIGGDAADVDFDQGTFWDQWQELADRLAALPAEIETILVALLPKVGAVANLAPTDVERTDGYAESYEPVFSVSANVLSGTKLAAVDAKIYDGNARILTVLTDAHAKAGAPDRLKFLDVFGLLDGYDFKNSLDAERKIALPSDVTIDNRYVAGIVPPQLPIAVVLNAGGFQSVDGMHASGCGYAVLASEAMKLLGLPHQREALLSRSFQEDALLSRFPLVLDVVVALLQRLRGLIRLGESLNVPALIQADGQHLAALLPQLQRILMP